VVLGGSYIAYELAEAFRHHGLHTTWLIRGPRFLHRILDEGGGALVDRLAREAGVEVHYGEQAVKVHGKNGAFAGVTTTTGRRFDGELLGVGLGLTLNTDFLRGTPVDVRSGVVTDEYLATNVPNVYAAGDVAEFYDLHLGLHHHMGTWNNASAQGRVAAANMLGGRVRYEEVPYYTSTLFDSSMTVLGATPDIRPDLEPVARVDLAARTYRRLFFLGDRLAGAALIGEIRARRQFIQLVARQEAARDRAAELLGL